MAAETARDFTIEAWVAKLVARVLLGLLLIAAIGYVVDYAVWRSRVAVGGGMDQVQVDLYIVAELKGGKEDYYPQGTAMVPCSQTIYPQGGYNPCWWQKKHTEKTTRY